MICGKAGVAAIWSILILLLSNCPPFRLISPVYGQIGIHCVDLGQSNSNYHSIGALQFKPKDLYPLGPYIATFDKGYPFFKDQKKSGVAWWDYTCPVWDIDWSIIGGGYAFIEYCPKDIEIRAYLVHQHGRVLRGWLHFEIELTDPTDEMQWIYVQTRDEYFNAIGEFVTADNEGCSTASNPELTSPSKYQALYCSATGLREAKTSQGVFVAKSTQYLNTVDKHYLPKRDLTRGIHLTWRLNEYWCNRHARFRLDAHVWTTKNMTTWRATRQLDSNGNTYICKPHNRYCRQRRKLTDFWIHPKWFGAADIKTDGPLNCTVPAIDFRSGAITPEPGTWLHSSSKMTAGTDYETEKTVEVVDFGNGRKQTRRKNCQVVPGPNAPSFGGRCEKHISSTKKTSTNQLQGCIKDPNAPEFGTVDTSQFIIYSELVNEINVKRLRQCEQTCAEPNTQQDLQDIARFPRTNASQEKYKAPVYFKTLQDARLEVRANTFFQTRKYHGNLCIFITMFLLPVSNFLIRYYKETFMHHLSLGCAPWFWVHMFVCIAVPTLYRSSYSALQESKLNFGTSESAEGTFHRLWGNVFVIVFLLMVVLGGVRPVVRGSRLLSMAMHSITGFGLYFLAIILVINSSYIPASPTVDDCDKNTGVLIATGFSYTAQMTVGWFFIDLVFHLLLTIFQFVVDKKYEIERSGFGLPIVPMLPAEAWGDLKGSAFRMIVLLVYVSLSLGMTFTTIRALFIDDDQKGCQLGTMSCNLSELRPNMPSSPFGCYSVSLRYYALVFERYDIKFNETIV